MTTCSQVMSPVWSDIQLFWKLRMIIAVNFQFKQLERSLKRSGLQRDSNLWPPRIPVRCSTNWAMKPNIGLCTCISHHFTPHRKILTSLPMCGFITQLVDHRIGIRGGHGLKFPWSPDLCRLLHSNCLNWKFTAMTIPNSQLQLQFKCELFQIYLTSCYCSVSC